MVKGRILITGASGYVGSYIYKSLKELGYSVVGTYNSTKLFNNLIQVDITDKNVIQRILNEESPALIIHVAANAHTRTCQQDPQNVQNLNINATKYIVDYARHNGCKVIYLSTFACYNNPISTVYARTKTEAEKLIKELEDYVMLRLSLCVGLSPNTEGSNFYNDLIKAIDNVFLSKLIPIGGLK